MALKRKAAGILAAALIISMLPVTAFAAEVSDTTDSDDTTTVTVTETGRIRKIPQKANLPVLRRPRIRMKRMRPMKRMSNRRCLPRFWRF